MAPLVIAAILGGSVAGVGWDDVTLTQRQTATAILIDHYGNWYGLPDEKKLEMFKTVDCETGHTFKTNLRSLVPKEQSFGLSQIFLPANLDVSMAEAKDPDFALNFMAKNFSKKLERKWTCWRNKYK